MIIEKDESLTEWIKKRIVEICDAEPVAFAKYVLALLKKDSSEEKLREICEEQLNVFLGSNTKEFVDGLFDALNNRSYMSSSQETVPGTSDSQNSINASQESKSESTSRSQRRRISPPRDSQGDSRSKDAARRRNRSRSRSPTRRRNYNDRRRSRSRSRSRSPHRRDHHRRERSDRNVVSSSAPTTRIRCRDYEEKGLCSRGEKCLYDHGPDPIVLDGDLPPPGVDVKRTNASNVEAYNPEAPGISAPATSNIAAFMPNFSVPPPGFAPQMTMNPMQGMMPMNSYMQQQQNMMPMQQTGGFVRGRGRGRGGRYGFSERVQPNKSSTIEVRRIPPEVNKLGIIHKHFEQFGDITNIQISFDGQKDSALVTYAKLPDAQAAMKSQKPILDNRFIQVAWHKPPPPKPEPTAETKIDQDSSLGNVKPVIPLMTEPKASNEHIPTSQLPQSEAARRVQQLAEEKLQARRKERQMHNHLKKIYTLKTQLYEKQVAELKGLLERISKATDPKVKIQLSSMVRKLDDALKVLTKEIHDLHEQIQKGEKSNGDDSNAKLMKKRRLNSTASADEGTDELEPVKKKEANEQNDSESQNGPPTDEDSIRKLLAQSYDSDEDDEPNKSRVKIEEEDEDEKVTPLLESA